MLTHPLRRFRETHEPPLSQEDLARLFGVTKATVSRWESGERFPDREFWPVIKETTGIATDELAEWKTLPDAQSTDTGAAA